MQGSLSVERMCRLAEVSRAGFYRWLEPRALAEEQMEVRAAIQAIVLEHRRRYGYRRVAAELRRRGLVVNHKRVARLMREDNLLAVERRAFMTTTDSDHELEVYLNLAARMKLTAINQLWVADITYIRLASEFVYLAVVLDAFSRKVVGWALERSLAARLIVAALEMAVGERQPPPGLVHHSDRGLQYASWEYVSVLDRHQIVASMSRAGNPYDNAKCESFFRTLKREEIDARPYRDLEDLRAHVEEFIGRYYNRCRLHSALGYRPPEEFEQVARDGAERTQAGRYPAAHMSFSEAWGNLSMRWKPTGNPGNRYDWLPGSPAGCSPAEPASASPAETHGEPSPRPGLHQRSKRRVRPPKAVSR